MTSTAAPSATASTCSRPRANWSPARSAARATTRMSAAPSAPSTPRLNATTNLADRADASCVRPVYSGVSKIIPLDTPRFANPLEPRGKKCYNDTQSQKTAEFRTKGSGTQHGRPKSP